VRVVQQTIEQRRDRRGIAEGGVPHDVEIERRSSGSPGASMIARRALRGMSRYDLDDDRRL
jgi:hypothetical protein